jgi:DnaJ like chaperone protein
MNLWRTISSFATPRAKPTCPECPERLPGEDPQFSAAVTALGAKLARADGRADRGEFEAFSEVFRPVPGAARDVHRLYDLARQTTRGFESYARQIARRYRGCPGLMEEVLDGLFHIAKADGAVTPEETAYIERVAELFGLSPLTFRRIKAAHLGTPADDPYALLHVAPDASDDAVRSAWKSALLEVHPDRAVSRGLNGGSLEMAHARSAAINAAYDQVMRERHDLVAADAI